MRAVFVNADVVFGGFVCIFIGHWALGLEGGVVCVCVLCLCFCLLCVAVAVFLCMCILQTARTYCEKGAVWF